MSILNSIFVTYFTFSHYLIIIHSFLLSIGTLSFMLPQLITWECLWASSFLVFAIELYLPNHIFQNGIYINVLCIVSVAVRASLVLMFPTVDTGRAEKLVLASVTFYRFPIVRHYLITNATEYKVFDVCDILRIHNPRIWDNIFKTIVHFYFYNKTAWSS